MPLRIARQLLVFGLYLLAALALTWPLVTRLGDGLAGGTWWWDGYHNTMIMATRAQSLLGPGPVGLYDYYWFAPLARTMVFNENELVLSLLYLPFHLAGCAPLVGHNLVLILSLALGGQGMFLLARRLTRSAPAAFVAGLAFAFCPYVIFELPRVQLVATLWVPLCLLLLHRALTRGRWRDVLGLAAVYAAQVGSGMYYAVLLLPSLGLAAAWIAAGRLRRGRPVRWLRLAVGAALAACMVGAMVWPYVVARGDHGLTFDREAIAEVDGELASLLRVNPENRTWNPLLHHRQRGGSESVAFPGLTLTLLALLGALAPLLAARRRRRDTLRLLGTWAGAGAAAAVAVLLAGNGLAALPVVGLAGWLWWRARPERIYPRTTALYLALLVLALALYAGIGWGQVAGREIVGLYDALRAWVPGFGSLRRIERLALLVMLPLAVLGASGLALCLSRLRRGWQRAALTVACALAVIAEAWTPPLPIKAAMAADQVPAVYRWLGAQPGPGPIAALPVRRGERRFTGDLGGSLHDYLTIFHKKRTVLGFSTWDSTLSRALTDELDGVVAGGDPLPLLRAAGARYLVVHAGDLDPLRRGRALGYLQSSASLRRVFRAGLDAVYELTAPPLPLWPVPPPPDAPHDAFRPARQAWSEGAVTALLPAARRVLGLEIRYAPGPATFGPPLAFVVETTTDGERWEEALAQREPGLFRDQIHRPARFVFRVVLPEPRRARGVRLRSLLPPPILGGAVGDLRLLVAR